MRAALRVTIDVDEGNARRPICMRIDLSALPSASARKPAQAPGPGPAPCPGDVLCLRLLPPEVPADVVAVRISLGGGAPGAAARAVGGADVLNLCLDLTGAEAEPVRLQLAPMNGKGPGGAPHGGKAAGPPAAKAHAPPRQNGAAALAEKSAVQRRLEGVAASMGLRSHLFKRAPGHPPYYEQTLEWRRDFLGAASVDQLCKSIIMENTRLPAPEVPAGQAPAVVVDGRYKYVVVVVQYTRKLHKERLVDAVRALEGDKALGKKQYNMRLVDGALSDLLSGFEHNAVTPLGLATPGLPIILHSAIAALPEGTFWLGGGEVDLKVRFDCAEFVEAFRPLVRDVCAE